MSEKIPVESPVSPYVAPETIPPVEHEHNDAETGALLGGLSGAVVGAAAGTLAGPVGTFIGAVAGGLMGAGASGLAVGAVDHVDDDATVTGVPSLTSGVDEPVVKRGNLDDNIRMSSDESVTGTNIGGHNVVTGEDATTSAGTMGLAAGAVAGGLIGTIAAGPVGAVVGGITGSLVGGVAGDAVEASDDAAELHEDSDAVLPPSPLGDFRNVDEGNSSPPAPVAQPQPQVQPPANPTVRPPATESGDYERAPRTEER